MLNILINIWFLGRQSRINSLKGFHIQRLSTQQVPYHSILKRIRSNKYQLVFLAIMLEKLSILVLTWIQTQV